MKIKMLRSKMGSNDGITTRMYLEGEEYEVSEALGESFVGEQLAEVIDEKAEKPVENKAVEKAPKDKAEKPVENKAA
jgi:hypothetical protein